MDGQNLHATKKRMVAELRKGKEIATQLLNLLRYTGEDDDYGGHGVSVQDLSLQILRSFGNTLSELNCCAALAESTQIPDAVDCGQLRKSPAGVKNRRGCYKRRRTPDSWIVESSTAEDGFAWRKYGQKLIQNSHYPRCYFRCTHKDDGCKAMKQVQIIREKPTLLYQITYINYHSCSSNTSTVRAYNNRHVSLSPLDLEPKNLISFKATPIDMANGENPTTIINPVKPEEHTDEVIPSDAKPATTPVQEDNLVESGQEGMGSGLQSCESTTLQYGMESDDQFDEGDIESFFWFDI